MTEEQIMAVLEDADAGLVREALALFLAEGEKAAPSRETPEFGNFAQALAFLKKNYGFAELDLFFTEADLVYVSTGGRRILLSDQPREKNAQSPENFSSGAAPSSGRRDAETEEHPPAAGKFPGRFSWLEI